MKRLHWILLLMILLIPTESISAKKKTEKSDREIWCDVMYRMAAPVLSNMSEGLLKQNMLVELSPTWDGRNQNVTYMECFGRLMAGLAPWLSLPDDETPEGLQRKQLREWALKSYANAVKSATIMLLPIQFLLIVIILFTGQMYNKSGDNHYPTVILHKKVSVSDK